MTINRLAGFTLLEVMIALAVFAISAIALLSQSNQGISQTLYLQEKSYALWIAENKLTKLRLAKNWPALGNNTDHLNQFNREWLITTSITGSGEKSLRRVDVEVSRADGEAPLSSLRGYIGQY